MTWSCVVVLLIGTTSHLFGQQTPIHYLVNEVVIPDSQRVIQAQNTERLVIRLSHPKTDTARYECRLDGLDDHWLSYQQQATLAYANIPGGTYRFAIRAEGASVRRILTIRIAPQLWQRWWFLPSIYFFLFLILASGLYFSYLYRLHQQAQMQQARDRIARDLHDDMGSYLSSISILSATLPADPERARQNLDRIGQTARQVMDAMSDIVWSVNPSQDSMQQILDRMKQVADELFGESHTQVRFEVGSGVENLTLPLERRRDFYLIYKEALTNAARYAHATEVQVRLIYEQGQLRLMVQDNGQGFDPANAKPSPGGGNGLKNGQVRATALSGTLRINSAVGAGTRVELTVPV